ncbi:MAG TPA: SNF2-related protein, partial [Thermoanaerobaculia bacterium]|nr:SNF2-related protein [Thermoanaerobaculia bacterium]
MSRNHPQLARSFRSEVRERGKAYFSGRRVRFESGAGDRILRARVEGARSYDVELEPAATVLRVSCTCPHFVREGIPCKHIWATILAADATGQLATETPLTALRLGEGPAGTKNRESHAPHDEPGGSRLAAIEDFRSRAWRWHLEKLEELGGPVETSPLPQASEIIYILDAESSREEQLLILEVAARSRRKDGEWGKTRPFTLRLSQIRLLPERSDQEILAILASSKSQYSSGFVSGWDSTVSRHRLPWPVPEFLLPMLAATERLWIRRGDRDYRPGLRWDEGSPWEFGVRVERDEQQHRYTLRGFLQRGEERIELHAPLVVLEGGMVVTEQWAGRLDDHGAWSWIELLRREKELIVPFGEKERLRSTLMAIRRRPPLELPAELSWEEVRITPRPRLQISRHRGRGESYEPLSAAVSYDYDEILLDAEESDEPVTLDANSKLLIRDTEAEQDAEQRLGELGLRSTWWPGHYRLHPARLGAVVRTLLEEGWHVEAEEGVYRAPGEVQLQVTSGVDWFEMEGKIRFGEREVSLPVLLQAIRKKQSFVELDDGSFGVVPEEWLERYASLFALAGESKGRLRFARNQLAFLDALLAARPEIDVDEALGRAREKLRSFEGIEPVDPPSGFQGELRGYQKEGLGWLLFLQDLGFGGCLADDMGLGKTVQVLALLEKRREQKIGRPSLVVVPRSLLFNWRAEAARFTPELRVLDYSGAERRQLGEPLESHDVVLVTYGTLRRDIADLKEVAFDYVILDEAQAIKNASTQSAKSARLLRASHRLALSGTPIENHLGELWSLFEFLNPGMLGRAAAFKK